MLLNKILSCLIFFWGVLIAALLYFSLGWEESFDAQYKTFLIAVAVLIPITLFISIKVWRQS